MTPSMSSTIFSRPSTPYSVGRQTSYGSSASSFPRKNFLDRACASSEKNLADFYSNKLQNNANCIENENNGNSKSEDFLQDCAVHLREFRAALRILQPHAGRATRILEQCLKGLLFLFDAKLSKRGKRIEELEKRVKNAEDDQKEVNTIRQRMAQIREEADRTKQAFEEFKIRSKEEIANLSEKNDELSDEVAKLTPDPRELENIVTLMEDFHGLIEKAEHESEHQKNLITKVGTTCAEMVGVTLEKGEKITGAKERGRVCQLLDGSIELIHHEAEDRGTFVGEVDLDGTTFSEFSKKQENVENQEPENLQEQVLLSMPLKLRALFAKFGNDPRLNRDLHVAFNREIPENVEECPSDFEFSQEDLEKACLEVIWARAKSDYDDEKLISQKSESFDFNENLNASSSNSLPLSDFVEDYYLQQNDEIRHAEVKVYQFLSTAGRHIHLTKNLEKRSAWVDFFCRGLGICELNRIIAPSLLTEVLKCLRTAVDLEVCGISKIPRNDGSDERSLEELVAMSLARPSENSPSRQSRQSVNISAIDKEKAMRNRYAPREKELICVSYCYHALRIVKLLLFKFFRFFKNSQYQN